MTINCPACEGQIEVGDDLLGEGLACPHCEHPFQLTAEGEVAEYEPEIPAGGGRKGLIIGACVAGVVVIVGGVMLLGSGGGPAGKTAAGQIAKPAGKTAGVETATEPVTPPSAMPAGAGEPVDELPPVEIPATPDGAIIAVSRAMAEGNPRGVWDALPASYQTDVTGLIHEYAKSTDPVMWDKGFGIAARVVGVLRDQKEFIFNSPIMAANPKKQDVAKNWDAFVGVLTTVLESDLGKRDRLLSLDMGRFLGSTGAELLADFESLAQFAPSNQWSEGVARLRGLTAKVVSTVDGVAEVEVSAPGETSKVEKFVQIEERWVPQAMTLDWESMISSARTNLAERQKGKQQAEMQGMMILGMVEGVVAQFENAASQEDFNQAAQGIFGMAAGLVGGRAPGTPGEAPSGFSSPPMKE